MKKLSQINERLFNNGVSRASNGEDRLESKLFGNIKDLQPVDLMDKSFLWSDRDLEVDGEEWFTYDQIVNDIEPKLKNYGWRFPTWDELLKGIPYFGRRVRTRGTMDDGYGKKLTRCLYICKAREHDEIACEFTGHPTNACPYFVKYDSVNNTHDKRYEIFYMTCTDDAIGRIVLRLGMLDQPLKCRLRLVKDRP